MKLRFSPRLLFACQLVLFFLTLSNAYEIKAQKTEVKRYLYVATPGIRDYLGFGGHGILVFDINNNHPND